MDLRQQVLKGVRNLRDMMGDEEIARGRAALMKHVGRLMLTPVMREGRPVYKVSGNISLPVNGDSGMLLVARDGIEPPTPAFSGL